MDDIETTEEAVTVEKKPGKRGGARPGTGGARPGAGRPKKVDPDKPVLIEKEWTMLELLRQVALGRVAISPQQLTAARTAVQYEHIKPGDGGVKAARANAAEQAHSEVKTTPPPGSGGG